MERLAAAPAGEGRGRGGYWFSSPLARSVGHAQLEPACHDCPLHDRMVVGRQKNERAN